MSKLLFSLLLLDSWSSLPLEVSQRTLCMHLHVSHAANIPSLSHPSLFYHSWNIPRNTQSVTWSWTTSVRVLCTSVPGHGVLLASWLSVHCPWQLTAAEGPWCGAPPSHIPSGAACQLMRPRRQTDSVHPSCSPRSASLYSTSVLYFNHRNTQIKLLKYTTSENKN